MKIEAKTDSGSSITIEIEDKTGKACYNIPLARAGAEEGLRDILKLIEFSINVPPLMPSFLMCIRKMKVEMVGDATMFLTDPEVVKKKVLTELMESITR